MDNPYLLFPFFVRVCLGREFYVIRMPDALCVLVYVICKIGCKDVQCIKLVYLTLKASCSVNTPNPFRKRQSAKRILFVVAGAEIP